jgi:hypothetical protein
VLSHDAIIIKKAIRICSRPDLGIVTIVDILKFGKLWAVRASKGGVFDQYDIIGLPEKEERLYKATGQDTIHSKMEWTKMKGVDMASKFFCLDNNAEMTIAQCRECYGKKKSEVHESRAVCKKENEKKEVSLKLDNIDVQGMREKNIENGQK